jgi:hypothetical protein
MRNNIVIISSNTAKQFFYIQCQLSINDVEIIACKLQSFKYPIIDFINQRDQRRKGDIDKTYIKAMSRSCTISEIHSYEIWVHYFTP